MRVLGGVGMFLKVLRLRRLVDCGVGFFCGLEFGFGFHEVSV